MKKREVGLYQVGDFDLDSISRIDFNAKGCEELALYLSINNSHGNYHSGLRENFRTIKIIDLDSVESLFEFQTSWNNHNWGTENIDLPDSLINVSHTRDCFNFTVEIEKKKIILKLSES